MRPAFRTTYWQNYPPPFYPGASGQYPVPGWGVQPVMAGPEYVGVGASFESKSVAPSHVFTATQGKVLQKIVTPSADTSQPTPVTPQVPWWAWPLMSAAALGALGYFGTRKGWF